MSMHPAVFLDRDGVINKTFIRNGKPYPPLYFDDLQILPGVDKALELLKKAGFCLIVVTNQPDVGRNTQTMAVVDQMHQYLQKTLPLDDIFTCIDETSENYKPLPGMLNLAARQYHLNLSKSYMVGDRWRDINAGRAAGCKTIFIDYQYKEKLEKPSHFTCSGLLEAAKIIVK